MPTSGEAVGLLFLAPELTCGDRDAVRERTMKSYQLARRDLLAAGGLGMGLAAAITSAKTQVAAPAPAAEGTIWSQEYWAQKGSVKLSLFRKRLGAPTAGAQPLPVLFLVHGSSLSARSSYDLGVPDGGTYSFMDVFARNGFDVWTMDHDGYGHSGSSGNNSDIMSGVEDLKAATPVVLAETGRSKWHFFGASSGSIRAAAFAQLMPERVDRLVLAASTYKGEGAAEIQRRRDRIVELRAHPRRKRDAAEMKFGDTIPAGTYVDMAVNLPLVDPAKVMSPVLMTRGEWDGNSTDDDLLDFFRQLRNGDRQYVILPNTAHSQGFNKNRQLLWYVMQNFLAAPTPIAS